jgi:taurine dioxygenase
MTTLEVTPSGSSCGATVGGVDLSSPLDSATVAAIRDAWLTHHVLAFPDQVLSAEALEQFTLHFGPFGDDPFFESIDGHRHIAAIHRSADETSSLFAESWHADWSFQSQPPDGTCLLSRVVPPSGGDTLFADQISALSRLPEGLRDQLVGLVAVHSARSGYAPDGLYGQDDTGRSMRIVADESAYATQTHPLITTHPETGEATLYGTIGYIIGIEGMERDAATELLLELYRWQTADEVVYRHRWEPDMLVMWDNRCVLHRATGGYDGHERLLHRTTIGYNPQVR